MGKVDSEDYGSNQPLPIEETEQSESNLCGDGLTEAGQRDRA